MFESWHPRTRRIASSVAYTALVALVAGLGYLTFRSLDQQRQDAEPAAETASDNETMPLVELDNFSSRRELTSDSERLNVSVRLRLTAAGQLNCYAFVVARNDHVKPKVWGVWPTQGPDGAITDGGHFQASNAKRGEPLILSPSWTRLNASISYNPGQAPYDMVMLYVVTEKGQVLLARPFSL